MAAVEPPLRDDELRVIRGMIDEYRYHEQRDTRLRAMFGSSRSVLMTLAAVGMLILQTVALVLAARGGK